MSTDMMEPEQSPIDVAVQQEMARRKRVLRSFLLLLLLPLIAGAWALLRAPKETALVAREVAPLVREDVSRTIESDVTEAVATKTRPVIQQTVAQQFNQTVLPEIGAVKQEVSGIRATMQENARKIAEASTQLAALPKVQSTAEAALSSAAEVRLEQSRRWERFSGQQQEYVRGVFAREQEARASLARDVAAAQQAIGALDKRVDTLERQLALIRRELAALRQRQPVIQ